jgi:hypothetical protein
MMTLLPSKYWIVPISGVSTRSSACNSVNCWPSLKIRWRGTPAAK